MVNTRVREKRVCLKVFIAKLHGFAIFQEKNNWHKRERERQLHRYMFLELDKMGMEKIVWLALCEPLITQEARGKYRGSKARRSTFIIT